MKKYISFILACFVLISCSKQEKKDIQMINAELKILRQHIAEDLKDKAHQMSEATKEKAKDLKGGASEKIEHVKDYSEEKWLALSKQFDIWKARLAIANSARRLELNADFDALRSEVALLREKQQEERAIRDNPERTLAERADARHERIKALEAVELRVKQIKEKFDR